MKFKTLASSVIAICCSLVLAFGIFPITSAVAIDLDNNLLAQSSLEISSQSNERTINDILTELYKMNESFQITIEDQAIDRDMVNKFLTNIDSEPEQINDFTIENSLALGKKRCTKWSKKGRRFCVQRISAFNWKWGWEYR